VKKAIISDVIQHLSGSALTIFQWVIATWRSSLAKVPLPYKGIRQIQKAVFLSD
jgi:hypothetical protein